MRFIRSKSNNSNKPSIFYNAPLLFIPETTPPFLYDVTILKLSGRINDIGPAKYISLLPTAELLSNEGNSGGALVSIAGWSRTSKDDKGLPPILQSIELPLSSQCTANTTVIQQCIGDDGKGACVGDESGPAIYNDQFVGILFQDSCSTHDVQNVYTSTIAVRDFLYNN